METERAVVEAVSETPAVIGAVMYAESIRHGPRIVIVPVPGPVMITGSVYNHTVIDIAAGITGCVTDIYHFRR